MLRALGYNSIERFHMNEGHASLLALELLQERARNHARSVFIHTDVEEVRRRCVFTTPTPVSAGHDRFSLDLVRQLWGRPDLFLNHEVFCGAGELNMTYLALNLSHYVNGVAKRHGEVSRQILTPRDVNHRYQTDSITNGAHLATWVASSFAALFDLRFRDADNFRHRTQPACTVADQSVVARPCFETKSETSCKQKQHGLNIFNDAP